MRIMRGRTATVSSFCSCLMVTVRSGESLAFTGLSPWIGFFVQVLAAFGKSLAISLNPPHNISVVLTSWSPPAVRVTWHYDPPPRLSPADRDASSPSGHNVSLYRFELTYRPVNARYRIVEEIPPDLRTIILDKLRPGVEYQLFLTSVPRSGLVTNKSKTIHFISPAAARKVTGGPIKGPVSSAEQGGPQSFTVREEEVVIVVLVLAVWVAVILLFFNKWGKIRMLEPYQPQYRPYSQPVPTKPPRLGISASLSAHMLDHDLPYHGGRSRYRQNSMFVHPYNRAYSLPEPTVPRKFKSAEDIKSLVAVQVTSHEDETTVL